MKAALLHDLDAEQAMIAAAIVTGEFADLTKMLSALSEADFFNGAHQTIWATIRELHSEQIFPDDLELPKRLHKKDELKKIGGISYLNELTRKYPICLYSERNIASILSLSKRRRARIDLKEKLAVIENPHSPPEQVAKAIGGYNSHYFSVTGGQRPTITFKGEGVEISASSCKLFELLSARKLAFTRGGTVFAVYADTLVPVTPEALQSLAESVCIPQSAVRTQNGARAIKSMPMSRESAGAALKCIQALEKLPKIATVNAAPILASSQDGGSVILLDKGYHDHAGGVLITRGDAVPLVQPDEAVFALTGLLADFDFITPSDHSRAIASLFTPALRLGRFLPESASGRFPCDYAQADESQSGKTFRQNVTAAIYGESPHVITMRTGGVGSGLDEAISSALIKGKPFVLLDNLRGSIDSQALEAITACYGTFHARALRTEATIDPRPFNWYLTTNGAQVTPDLKNRLTIISIRKRPKAYPFKKYAEGDVLDHVRAKQSYYLGCVHAIIREWHRQGRLVTNESRHNFREWARVADWIVQNIFKAAPLMDGHIEAGELTSDANKVFLRKLALKMVHEHPLDRNGETENFSASQIAEFIEESGSSDLSIPGAKGSAAGPHKILGRLLARILGSKPQIIGDEPPFNLGGVWIIRRMVWSDTRERVPIYRFSTSAPSGSSG